MNATRILRTMAGSAIDVNNILDSVLPLEAVNLERVLILTPFGEAPPIPADYDLYEDANLILYHKVQEGEEDEEEGCVVVWAYRKW
ncbi:hypothetical protein QE152_g38677 [Popillia japonica]|uniref:Uncharacterized protein n=1 Tax=Popillia japonica TaxID=7064 RepID=A0AAW1HWC3_POPJA